MRDHWYGDNRDLVKWAILFKLAEIEKASQIIQVAYYQPSAFPRIQLDGKDHDIPSPVIEHFRRIQNISSTPSAIEVKVFDFPLKDRDEYLKAVMEYVSRIGSERFVILLDPDTGLEPNNPSLKHILAVEAATIWQKLKPNDVLAIYQHQTNRAGQAWIEPKQNQLARILSVREKSIKIGSAFSIARDVVILYAGKS